MSGLSAVAMAAVLIAGEVSGFASPSFAGLWPWAVFVAAVMWSSVIGWRIPLGGYIVVALLGLALAWRTESNRLALEAQAWGFGEAGTPPSFDLKVDGGVICRRRFRNGGWLVSFLSHVGGIEIKVVAPVSDRGHAPQSGEIWRCAGWLSLKKSAPSRYARRTLWIMDETHLMRVAKAKRRTAFETYRRMSDLLARHIGTGLRWCPELAGLGRAMLLGRRAEVTAERKKVFSSAGTMHVFAISGLHVMMVAALLRMFLGRIGLSSRACAACVIPILAAYVMLTGSSPSAVRAAFMVSLWLGAELFGRKPDSLAAWGSAALVIYGVSPEMVFDAGCTLSFAVMLGIALWTRWARQFATPLDWLRRIAEREQMLGATRRVASLLAWYRRGSWLLGALGISCAAWIASAPILAKAFGKITLGSLVANIVVVPLAGISVVLGAAGMVISMVAPPIGALFNNLSALCIWVMEQVSEAVAMCPGSSWDTLPWSWSDCFIWYLAWVLLFAVLSRHIPQREMISIKTWELENADENI